MKKHKNDNIIIPWWVFVILGIILLGVGLFENLTSTKLDFDLMFKAGGVIVAGIAIYLTIKRMKQTQDQTAAISENTRYLNFQNHQKDFLEHFSIFDITQIMAERNRIDSKFLNKVIYESYYYSDYNDFKPSININAGQILGAEIYPLLQLCSKGDYVLREDKNAIETTIGTLGNLDYTQFVNVLGKGVLRSIQVVDKNVKFCESRIRLFYHLKILLHIYSFQRIEQLTQDDLLETLKPLRSYFQSLKTPPEFMLK